MNLKKLKNAESLSIVRKPFGKVALWLDDEVRLGVFSPQDAEALARDFCGQ